MKNPDKYYVGKMKERSDYVGETKAATRLNPILIGKAEHKQINN